MGHRQTVDASDRTAVGVCTCGWRCLTASRSAAWSELNSHANGIHGGNPNTQSAASYHRRKPT